MKRICSDWFSGQSVLRENLCSRFALRVRARQFVEVMGGVRIVVMEIFASNAANVVASSFAMVEIAIVAAIATAAAISAGDCTK